MPIARFRMRYLISLLVWVAVVEMALLEEEEDLLTECTEKVSPPCNVADAFLLEML